MTKNELQKEVLKSYALLCINYDTNGKDYYRHGALKIANVQAKDKILSEDEYMILHQRLLGSNRQISSLAKDLGYRVREVADIEKNALSKLKAAFPRLRKDWISKNGWEFDYREVSLKDYIYSKMPDYNFPIAEREFIERLSIKLPEVEKDDQKNIGIAKPLQEMSEKYIEVKNYLFKLPLKAIGLKWMHYEQNINPDFINTVGKLIECSSADILKWNNYSSIRVQKIEDCLAKIGLMLKI